MITTKKDWVNDHLAENNFFTSAHQNNNTFFDLINSEIVFRFIDYNKYFIYFVTITCDDDDTLKKVEDGITVRNLFEYYYQTIPKFFVLIIHNKKFYIKIRNKAIVEIDFLSFLKMFFSDIGQNAGTFKSINKSMNDFFQEWTRKNLSRYSVISDIDALHLSPTKKLFFELKRISGDFKTWMPYLDDKSNYLRLRHLTDEMKGEQRVVAYSVENHNNQVAYFYNLKFTADCIIGKKLIAPASEILTKQEISSDLLQKSLDFKSYNKRVQY